MSAFLVACFSAPTVVFTVLLLVILIYWLFVIVGAFDIDMLDSVGHGADGLLDGAAEGLEGALDGALDGAAEGLEGALDGALDGAAESLEGALDGLDGAVDGALDGLDGAAEGALDGAAEGASEAAAGTIEGVGGLAGFFALLRLRRVPITVSMSFIVLFSWAASILGMGTLEDWLALRPEWLWPAALGVGLLSVLVALPLTALAITPFAGFFVTHSARGRSAVIGQICVISTGRVDARFGQAYCQVDSDELLIMVCCDRPNTLSHGKEALVVDFDEKRQAYLVEPVGEP